MVAAAAHCAVVKVSHVFKQQFALSVDATPERKSLFFVESFFHPWGHVYAASPHFVQHSEGEHVPPLEPGHSVDKSDVRTAKVGEAAHCPCVKVSHVFLQHCVLSDASLPSRKSALFVKSFFHPALHVNAVSSHFMQHCEAVHVPPVHSCFSGKGIGAALSSPQPVKLAHVFLQHVSVPVVSEHVLLSKLEHSLPFCNS